MLRLEAVAKRFGSVQVLDEVSFELRRGELLTLLGPSGCGKSTTLRLIAGLEIPDAGKIVCEEQPWFCSSNRVFVKPQERNVGLVFQNYAIWPHMSVAEHVAYPLRVRGRSDKAIEARCRELLEIVGLGERGDAPAVVLSGGEQQRVAIARALAAEPRILLLDEPFSNLDVALRDQMRLEIRALRERLGLTVLLVTHDQADAFILSDRIAVMQSGRLQQLDSPERVYLDPASDFVREFVGESNVLGATVKELFPGRCTVRLDGAGELDAAWPNGRCAAAAGERVTVWFRPENLRVAEKAPAGPPPRLAGRIADRIFFGDCYQCRLQLGAATQVKAYVAVSFRPRIGQQVELSIDPGDVHLIREGVPGAAPGNPSPAR